MKFVASWIVIDQTGGIFLPGTVPPATEFTATCQLNLAVSSKCYVVVFAVVHSGKLREVLMEMC